MHDDHVAPDPSPADTWGEGDFHEWLAATTASAAVQAATREVLDAIAAHREAELALVAAEARLDLARARLEIAELRARAVAPAREGGGG